MPEKLYNFEFAELEAFKFVRTSAPSLHRASTDALIQKYLSIETKSAVEY